MKLLIRAVMLTLYYVGILILIPVGLIAYLSGDKLTEILNEGEVDE